MLISKPAPRFTGSAPVVVLGREHDPLRGVVDVEELAVARAGAPDLDHLVAALHRLHALADEGGDDVGALGVEVVARAVEVHGQEVDRS